MAGSYKSFHDGSNVWTKVDLNYPVSSNYQKQFYAYYNNTLPSNLTSGLIHWYKLNNTANDSGSSPSNGTLSGFTYVDDFYHNATSAIQYNATSNYVNCNYIPALNTALTFSFWFNSNDMATANQWVASSCAGNGNNAGYGATLLNSNSKLQWAGFTPNTGAFLTTSNTVFSTGVWYHVICTYSGDTSTNGAKIYINGILDSQATPSQAMGGSASNNLFFGNTHSAGSQPIRGRANNFMHWNRVLSQDEITQLYNLQRPSQIDGTSVFDFFDDFEGSALSSQWSGASGTTNGAETVANGLFSFYGSTASNRNIWAPNAIPIQNGVGRVIFKQLATGNYNNQIGIGTPHIYNGSYAPASGRTWISTGASRQLTDWYKSGSDYALGTSTNLSANWHISEFDLLGSSGSVLIDGSLYASLTSTHINTTVSYTPCIYYNAVSAAQPLDYFFTTKYTSSTVTISYGAAESDGYVIEGKNFSNRKLVTVTVPTASGELTNFQISMPNSNFNSQGDVLIAEGYNYWNQDATTVWAKIGKIPANSSKTISVTQRVNVDDNIVNRGLIHNWKFQGNTNDSIGSANLTNSGATASADLYGRSNNSYDYNGSSNYMYVADSDDWDMTSSSTKSFSLWFKQDITGADDLIRQFQDGTHTWLLGVNASNQITFYSYSAGYLTGFPLTWTAATAPIGQWNHLVFVKDTTNHTVYLNGVSLGTQSATGTATYAGYLSVGAYASGGFFDGNITKIKHYNVALTAQEALLLYNGEKLQKGNGQGTFDLFDDFDGTTNNTLAWTDTHSGGTVTYGNSTITMTGDMTANTGLVSIKSFPANYSFYVQAKWASASATNLYDFGWNWYGASSNNFAKFQDVTGGNAYMFAYQDSGTGSAVTNYPTTNLEQISTLYKNYEIQRFGTTSIIYKMGSASLTQSTKVTSATIPAVIGSNYSTGNGGTMTIDYAYVRKLNSTEPSVSISGSNPYTVTITNGTANDLIDYQIQMSASSLGMTTQSYNVIIQDYVAPTTTDSSILNGTEF